MIDYQSNSNGISVPNKLFQSSIRRKHRKIQNITINNGDGEKTSLCWEKNNDDIW